MMYCIDSPAGKALQTDIIYIQLLVLLADQFLTVIESSIVHAETLSD